MTTPPGRKRRRGASRADRPAAPEAPGVPFPPGSAAPDTPFLDGPFPPGPAADDSFFREAYAGGAPAFPGRPARAASAVPPASAAADPWGTTEATGIAESAGETARSAGSAAGRGSRARGRSRQERSRSEKPRPEKSRSEKSRSENRFDSGSRLEEWGLTPFQRRAVVAAAVLAGVVGTIVAMVLIVGSLGQDVVPERATTAALVTQPRPDVYKGWASPKLFAPIAQSKADPKPLTVKDVFAAKTVKEGKVTLRLAATDLGADCPGAAWGQLADRLARGGCTQVARGLYTSADGRYVAMYALFNLRDAASADGLVQEMTTAYRGGWVKAPQSGKAVFPSGGYTEGSGYAMGHYAGLAWVGRADGAEPGPRDDFVTLTLAVRGAERAVFRRVVAADPAS
ncbi:hypothetical protein [Streptosporangium pseudovulgare]|uniref:Uncharacterized protein n=1 Tax=Streptosporangium pseudovulgare TaxID=35765 RepID=A0ABQ2QD70_9ACTN|nr:hypothetical protein [Streptosporangium pseudovulgare]GGP76701.1 hypothetical protein GCM10010140_00630 [Streptosporangium pseudovulgare]